MKTHYRFGIGLLSFLLPLQLAVASVDGSARKLVVVGGGKVSDAMRTQLLSLTPAANPRVLIVPQAARPADLPTRSRDNADAFRRLGVTNVVVLDLGDLVGALKAIQDCDAIWMPGGLQSQLMRALDDAGVANAIRARVAAGVPIGGTSAGAAIMSEVMLAGSRRDEATGEAVPTISRGLGFWPEVIVDQHFTQRKRFARLVAAVEKHPTCLGVGIDENTAVVVEGNRFRVMGEHTVTVLRASNPGDAKPVLQTVVLKAGETYDFAATAIASTNAAGAFANSTGSSDPYAGKSVPEICDDLTPRLMEAHRVPGVSIAVVRDHKLTWLGQYGVKTFGQTNPVTAATIFEAASMSKPVFAYAVLHLVQEGLLDLDTPLVEILGRCYIENEPRHERITARMVLTHTSGLPNWRPGGWRAGGPLPVLFEPGTRRQYSGEGFLFLQRAVEQRTGVPLEEFMQQRLLRPLGMTNSSYVWNEARADQAAAGHTREGRLPERERTLYRAANSAFTLYTTPADYAQFLIEMMRPDRSGRHSLNAPTLEMMLTIAPEPKGGAGAGQESDESSKAQYGLSWRVELREEGKRVFHSGSNGTGFRCYAEFQPRTGNGIVIMTNGAKGNELWADLIRHAGGR